MGTYNTVRWAGGVCDDMFGVLLLVTTCSCAHSLWFVFTCFTHCERKSTCLVNTTSSTLRCRIDESVVVSRLHWLSCCVVKGWWWKSTALSSVLPRLTFGNSSPVKIFYVKNTTNCAVRTGSEGFPGGKNPDFATASSKKRPSRLQVRKFHSWSKFGEFDAKYFAKFKTTHCSSNRRESLTRPDR